MGYALYPWQVSDYSYLLKLKARLPHAVILDGAKGLGGLNLANVFIQSLLCENPDGNGNSCKECNSCSLYSTNSHPDYYSLSVGDDEKMIAISSVREVSEFLSVSTHLGQYKIVLVEDAGLLNINSSNALLKILEEPPSYAVFILVSDNVGKLLPTIISRCQKYKLTIPDTNVAKQYLIDKDIPNSDFWLRYYDNCPLFDIEISEEQFDLLIKVLSKPSVDNIYEFSNNIDPKNNSFIFGFMTKWLSDLISFKLTRKLNYFTNYEEAFNLISEKQDDKKTFYLQDKLSFLLEWENHSLNHKLQIENILFQYQQVFVK